MSTENKHTVVAISIIIISYVVAVGTAIVVVSYIVARVAISMITISNIISYKTKNIHAI